MASLNNDSCHSLYSNYTYNSSDDWFDVWAYIACSQGNQQQDLAMIIPLTVLNIIIFVTGLLGNIAVCLVFVKHPSMHTATNYYLFNLAVSDLTLLIFGLPHDVAIYWHLYPWTLGEAFCKLRALLSETSSYVSVLTIVAFSTERYLAICYPLYLHKMSGLKRAVRIISVLWIIAFFSALPFAVYTNIRYLKYPNTNITIEESALCGMLSQPEDIPLYEISTTVFFIIPLLAISVQYTMMGISISQTAKKTLGKGLKGSVHRNRNKKLQTNRSVIRMLSLVVVGFFVCWAPFHAQRLAFVYFRDWDNYEEINIWMFVITGILYYFSSTLNPILYNVMSDKMRNAFKEVICGVKTRSSSLKKNNSTVREHTYITVQHTQIVDDEDTL